jgi:tetratricopeptide (TPR) repeat protein
MTSPERTRPVTRARLLTIAAIAIVLAAAFLWRPLAAWWCDDRGNIALARGDRASARAWFQRGLTYAPASSVLLEDRGRASLDEDPSAAMADFTASDCGEPCIAERGDAEVRLGRAGDAVRDYLAAHAAGRITTTVAGLSAQHRYDEALAIEHALIRGLDPVLDQADIAAAEAQVGDLDVSAAKVDAIRRTAYRRDAIKAFATANRLAPLNEGYLLSLGYSQMQWGDRREARRAFERELELHPTQPDAERGLALLGKES